MRAQLVFAFILLSLTLVSAQFDPSSACPLPKSPSLLTLSVSPNTVDQTLTASAELTFVNPTSKDTGFIPGRQVYFQKCGSCPTELNGKKVTTCSSYSRTLSPGEEGYDEDDPGKQASFNPTGCCYAEDNPATPSFNEAQTPIACDALGSAFTPAVPLQACSAAIDAATSPVKPFPCPTGCCYTPIQVFASTTDTEGKAQIVLPFEDVSLVAWFKGDNFYMPSNSTGAYQSAQLAGVNFAACFPIFLLLGLLMAAMHASGRSPFALIDFSASAAPRARQKPPVAAMFSTGGIGALLKAGSVLAKQAAAGKKLTESESKKGGEKGKAPSMSLRVDPSGKGKAKLSAGRDSKASEKKDGGPSTLDKIAGFLTADWAVTKADQNSSKLLQKFEKAMTGELEIGGVPLNLNKLMNKGLEKAGKALDKALYRAGIDNGKLTAQEKATILDEKVHALDAKSKTDAGELRKEAEALKKQAEALRQQAAELRSKAEKATSPAAIAKFRAAAAAADAEADLLEEKAAISEGRAGELEAERKKEAEALRQKAAELLGKAERASSPEAIAKFRAAAAAADSAADLLENLETSKERVEQIEKEYGLSEEIKKRREAEQKELHADAVSLAKMVAGVYGGLSEKLSDKAGDQRDPTVRKQMNKDASYLERKASVLQSLASTPYTEGQAAAAPSPTATLAPQQQSKGLSGTDRTASGLPRLPNAEDLRRLDALEKILAAQGSGSGAPALSKPPIDVVGAALRAARDASREVVGTERLIEVANSQRNRTFVNFGRVFGYWTEGEASTSEKTVSVLANCLSAIGSSFIILRFGARDFGNMSGRFGGDADATVERLAAVELGPIVDERFAALTSQIEESEKLVKGAEEKIKEFEGKISSLLESLYNTATKTQVDGLSDKAVGLRDELKGFKKDLAEYRSTKDKAQRAELLGSMQSHSENISKLSGELGANLGSVSETAKELRTLLFGSGTPTAAFNNWQARANEGDISEPTCLLEAVLALSHFTAQRDGSLSAREMLMSSKRLANSPEELLERAEQSKGRTQEVMERVRSKISGLEETSKTRALTQDEQHELGMQKQMLAIVTDDSRKAQEYIDAMKDVQSSFAALKEQLDAKRDAAAKVAELSGTTQALTLERKQKEEEAREAEGETKTELKKTIAELDKKIEAVEKEEKKAKNAYETMQLEQTLALSYAPLSGMHEKMSQLDAVISSQPDPAVRAQLEQAKAVLGAAISKLEGELNTGERKYEDLRASQHLDSLVTSLRELRVEFEETTKALGQATGDEKLALEEKSAKLREQIASVAAEYAQADKKYGSERPQELEEFNWRSSGFAQAVSIYSSTVEGTKGRAEVASLVSASLSAQCDQLAAEHGAASIDDLVMTARSRLEKIDEAVEHKQALEQLIPSLEAQLATAPESERAFVASALKEAQVDHEMAEAAINRLSTAGGDRTELQQTFEQAVGLRQDLLAAGEKLETAQREYTFASGTNAGFLNEHAGDFLAGITHFEAREKGIEAAPTAREEQAPVQTVEEQKADLQKQLEALQKQLEGHQAEKDRIANDPAATAPPTMQEAATLLSSGLEGQSAAARVEAKRLEAELATRSEEHSRAAEDLRETASHLQNLREKYGEAIAALPFESTSPERSILDQRVREIDETLVSIRSLREPSEYAIHDFDKDLEEVNRRFNGLETPPAGFADVSKRLDPEDKKALRDVEKQLADLVGPEVSASLRAEHEYVQVQQQLTEQTQRAEQIDARRTEMTGRLAEASLTLYSNQLDERIRALDVLPQTSETTVERERLETERGQLQDALSKRGELLDVTQKIHEAEERLAGLSVQFSQAGEHEQQDRSTTALQDLKRSDEHALLEQRREELGGSLFVSSEDLRERASEAEANVTRLTEDNKSATKKLDELPSQIKQAEQDLAGLQAERDTIVAELEPKLNGPTGVITLLAGKYDEQQKFEIEMNNKKYTREEREEASENHARVSKEIEKLSAEKDGYTTQQVDANQSAEFKQQELKELRDQLAYQSREQPKIEERLDSAKEEQAKLLRQATELAEIESAIARLQSPSFQDQLKSETPPESEGIYDSIKGKLEELKKLHSDRLDAYATLSSAASGAVPFDSNSFEAMSSRLAEDAERAVSLVDKVGDALASTRLHDAITPVFTDHLSELQSQQQLLSSSMDAHTDGLLQLAERSYYSQYPLKRAEEAIHGTQQGISNVEQRLQHLDEPQPLPEPLGVQQIQKLALEDAQFSHAYDTFSALTQLTPDAATALLTTSLGALESAPQTQATEEYAKTLQHLLGEQAQHDVLGTEEYEHDQQTRMETDAKSQLINYAVTPSRAEEWAAKASEASTPEEAQSDRTYAEIYSAISSRTQLTEEQRVFLADRAMGSLASDASSEELRAPDIDAIITIAAATRSKSLEPLESSSIESQYLQERGSALLDQYLRETGTSAGTLSQDDFLAYVKEQSRPDFFKYLREHGSFDDYVLSYFQDERTAVDFILRDFESRANARAVNFSRDNVLNDDAVTAITRAVALEPPLKSLSSPSIDSMARELSRVQSASSALAETVQATQRREQPDLATVKEWGRVGESEKKNFATIMNNTTKAITEAQLPEEQLQHLTDEYHRLTGGAVPTQTPTQIALK